MIYLNTSRPDFVTLQELTDTPLALLSDDEIQPPPEALVKIVAED